MDYALSVCVISLNIDLGAVRFGDRVVEDARPVSEFVDDSDTLSIRNLSYLTLCEN